MIVVPSGPPLNATFTKRGKYSLTISWKSPEQKLPDSNQKEYSVCYSIRAKANNPRCTRPINVLSYTINNLQPSTKYSVTVVGGASLGYGPESDEISKITSGGKQIIYTVYWTTQAARNCPAIDCLALSN